MPVLPRRLHAGTCSFFVVYTERSVDEDLTQGSTAPSVSADTGVSGQVLNQRPHSPHIPALANGMRLNLQELTLASHKQANQKQQQTTQLLVQLFCQRRL